MNKDKFEKIRSKILSPRPNIGYEIIRAAVSVLQNEIDTLIGIRQQLKMMTQETSTQGIKKRETRGNDALVFVKANPDQTAPEIAKSIGSKPKSAHSMMATLEKNGSVHSQKHSNRSVTWRVV
jgi:predicted HTH transcriptional regulator